ncbi:MAG TPA: TadE family protein [Terracidiphilus sp.]|nr:TadE family protein [Terracidiphilus sp.]
MQSSRNSSGQFGLILARVRRSLAFDREGGALVEFALVAPLMMALMTGMFSISIVMNNYMVLTNGVGEGARALALARGQTTPTLASTDPCQYAVNTAQAASSTLATGSIGYSIIYTNNSTATPTSTPYTTSCPGLTMNANDTVQMTATYRSSLSAYGWMPPSFNLMARTTENVQ